MDAGHEGVYHADNADAHTVLVRAAVATQDGLPVDLVAVLAADGDGSGLDEGWNVRRAKREDAIGGWTPN